MTDIHNMQFGVIAGSAGSGKTYAVRQKIADDPSWGLMTATTGVAARILGDNAPTVNAACGFYDIDSLKRAHERGVLCHNLREIRNEHARVVIDEASMLNAETLTVLTEDAVKAGVGIVLTGDWQQLPPVKGEWAWKSPYWKTHYAPNVKRLTSQYRQKDPTFLQGLNALRLGDGATALPLLKRAGVTMSPIPQGQDTFDGLTIVPTNGLKDAIDNAEYDAIEGDEQVYPTERWGDQHPDWKDIPASVEVKPGMKAMILRNKYDDNGRLVYANGETGTVQSADDDGVYVRRRDGSEVFVEYDEVDNAEYVIVRHGKTRERQVIKPATGGVKYLPLDRAFACTVHKSQGLTVTTPLRLKLWAGSFWSNPASVYVAASRVTEPSLLDIAGGDFVANDKTFLEEKTVAATDCFTVFGETAVTPLPVQPMQPPAPTVEAKKLVTKAKARKKRVAQPTAI